jgi:hypothetical protein
MRVFPYFVSEAALTALGLMAIPVALLFQEAAFFALSAIAILIAGLLAALNLLRERDFSESVKRIKDFGGWDADFLSLGTLRLRYRGKEFRYRSMIGPAGESIPVDYFISTPSAKAPAFDVSSDGGALPTGGLPPRLRPAVESFSKAYPLRRLRLSGGLLEVTARLEFERGPPPSKEEKLEDMAGFLEDFLSFAYDADNILSGAVKGGPPG